MSAPRLLTAAVPTCFLSLLLDLFRQSPASNRLITSDDRKSIHSLYQGHVMRSGDLAVGGGAEDTRGNPDMLNPN